MNLALFALWRLAQSILDADGLGTSPGMLVRRVAYFISTLANAGFAVLTGGMVLGFARKSCGEGDLQSWVSWLMQHPLGA